MPRRDRRDFHRSADGDIWIRVVKSRRQDCGSLKREVVQEIVEDVEGKSATITDPCDQFSHLLQHHFETATNDTLPNEKRRGSWSTVRSLLSQVDSHLGRRQNDEETTETATSNNATTSAVNVSKPSTAALASSTITASTSSAATTTTTSNATRKAPPAASPSVSASTSAPTQNGQAKPLLNNGEKQTSTTASSRPFTTPSIRPSTTATSVQSSAPPKPLSVHPSLANPPVIANGNGHGNGPGLPVPPPYQRRSNSAVAYMVQKNARPNFANKTTTSTTVPIHPSLQRSSFTANPTTRIPAVDVETTMASFSPPRFSATTPNVPRQSQTTAPLPILPEPRVQSVAASTSTAISTSTATANRPLPTSDMDTSDENDDGAEKTSKDHKKVPNPLRSVPGPLRAPPDKPTVSTVPTEVLFEADPANSAYSSGLEGRKAVKALFRKQFPTGTMSGDVGRRFGLWEPYWKVSKAIHVGVTVPIDKLMWSNYGKGIASPQTPKTAASFIIPALKPETIQLLNSTWGQEQGPPKDGEYRLIFRMLPLKVDPKKKRADCHLWPKGTFLTVNGAPIRLHQRKQQAHDYKLWKGMCKHLDMASVITNPGLKSHIEICLHDSEQYFFSLAVCQYQAPATLTKQLLSSDNQFLHLHRLSYDESMEKAMHLINHQTVVIEDIDDDILANDDKKFVFSLVCPISKVPMNTPVRGKHCKHWQCFDLEYFLQCNSSVSGGRWRCASCETFLSHQELELCGLTQEALKSYAGQVSYQQDRVELRADRTYSLLQPNKMRYGNKKRSNDGFGNKANPIKTVIEEIVID